MITVNVQTQPPTNGVAIKLLAWGNPFLTKITNVNGQCQWLNLALSSYPVVLSVKSDEYGVESEQKTVNDGQTVNFTLNLNPPTGIKFYVNDVSDGKPIQGAVCTIYAGENQTGDAEQATTDADGYALISQYWFAPKSISVKKTGYHDFKEIFALTTINVNLTPTEPNGPNGPNGPTGCFILTALGDGQLVNDARAWRDERPLFISTIYRLYYVVSPPIAYALRLSHRIRHAVKRPIELFIRLFTG